MSTPDDHFTSAPDCRVSVSARGRVVGAGGCPRVRAGIVSPAGVKRGEILILSAPDDHFTATPDGRAMLSAIGRASGRNPGIIGASAHSGGYYGQCIVSSRRCHYLWH